MTEEFFKANISGRSNPDIARDLLPHLSEQEKEAWIVDKEAYFCDLARTQIKPVEGLEELVAWIKGNQLKMAAVTNAPRTNAEMILGGLGLTDTFDLLVIANGTNPLHPPPSLAPTLFRACPLLSILTAISVVCLHVSECERNKPHPDPYLKAMETLGLRPEDCCVVEDSVPGATAGLAAECHTIGILTSQTDEVMKGAGVPQTIHDYHELLAEIRQARETQ